MAIAAIRVTHKDMTHKIFVNANAEYVMGHLRYGHYEGTLDLTDEEFKEFKENPTDFLNKHDCHYDFEFFIDDWEIDDIGDMESPTWKEINPT